MVLLAWCMGVDEEDFREVFWRWRWPPGQRQGDGVLSFLLRGLFLDRSLKGVRPVVYDEHEGIKAAPFGKLPGVEWQRCIVHFERNVLSHVPASSITEVAEDLKALFKVRREKNAKALAEEFVELYGSLASRKRFRFSRPA